MNLSVGIIGLPNAGKSTLFNALLKKQQALVASYPFATIEPNIGIVPVPDERLEKLAEFVEKNEKVRPPIVPAVIKFVDIAGLVKGASQGEGLGNKFLAHIREVDIICHVLRFFEERDIAHVAGSIDPKRDKEIIETELMLADLQTLEKQEEPRGVKDKDTQFQWEIILKLKSALESGKRAASVISSEKEALVIRSLNLLTAKKILYVCNFSENQLQSANNNSLTKDFDPAIVICAKIEEQLAGLPEKEQSEYLQTIGFAQSGLNRLVTKSYEMLNLISFLTQGVIEVKAWTITKGTLAPQASGVIHTDFEKKFIKADVISFNDLISNGSFTAAKESGKVRLEGRDYVMQDGDVVEFRIGS